MTTFVSAAPTHRVNFVGCRPPIPELEVTLDEHDHIEVLQDAIEQHVQQATNTEVTALLSADAGKGGVYTAHGSLGTVTIARRAAHLDGWTWEPRHIAAGTVCPDEPNRQVPAGWWVVGTAPGEHDTGSVWLHLAADQEDNDSTEALARDIAAALRAR